MQCTAPHNACHNILHCSVQNYAKWQYDTSQLIQHNTIRHYTALCNTTLFDTILHHTILWNTILCYTTLSYNIKCFTIRCCTTGPNEISFVSDWLSHSALQWTSSLCRSSGRWLSCNRHYLCWRDTASHRSNHYLALNLWAVQLGAILSELQ